MMHAGAKILSLIPVACSSIPVAIPQQCPAIPWFVDEGGHGRPGPRPQGNHFPAPGWHGACPGRAMSRSRTRPGFVLRSVETGRGLDRPVPGSETDPPCAGRAVDPFEAPRLCRVERPARQPGQYGWPRPGDHLAPWRFRLAFGAARVHARHGWFGWPQRERRK